MDGDKEQNSVKEDILQFVREHFKKSTDIGSLTVKQIRVAYLEEKNKPALTVVEKSCFKPIIEEVFIEFSQKEESFKNDERAEEDKDDQLDDCKGTDSTSEMSSDNKLTEEQDSEHSDDDNEASNSDSNSEPDEPLKKRGDESSNGMEFVESVIVKNRTVEVKLKRISIMKNATTDDDDDDKTRHMNSFNGTVTSSATSVNNITEKSSDNNSSDEQESDNQSDSNKIVSASKTKKRKRVISSSGSDSELDKPLKQRKDNGSKEFESPVKGSPKKKKSRKIREKEQKSKKKSVKNENKPPKKDSKMEESKELKLLKSCCRAAGLFVHYTKVFGDCSYDEEKEKVLLGLLKEAGLRGKPSVNACKKLRLKREEKKALEDLDTANIISSTGRSHRGSTGIVMEKRIPDTALSEIKKSYSRLKGIIDSEESNSE